MGVQLKSTHSSGHHQCLFMPEFVAENLKAHKNQRKRSLILQHSFAQKNLTNFTNVNSFEIENKMLPKHRQKTFSVYKFFFRICFCLFSEKTFAQYHFLMFENYFFSSTLMANVSIFLFISLRKFLFPRRTRFYLVV